jgi:hypothetical protein
MMMRLTRPGIVLAILAGFAVACSDDPVSSDDSPLAGLTERTGNDSVGNPIPGEPTEPTTPTPGFFRGTVLGQAEAPGGGVDTLETAPRVSGVVVTAYPLLGGSSPDYDLGDAAATVTTGADGKFSLPELPGGDYVVTFAPPSSSTYRGIWVTAYIFEQSGEHPWWVVLPKK